MACKCPWGGRNALSGPNLTRIRPLALRLCHSDGGQDESPLRGATGTARRWNYDLVFSGATRPKSLLMSETGRAAMRPLWYLKWNVRIARAETETGVQIWEAKAERARRFRLFQNTCHSARLEAQNGAHNRFPPSPRFFWRLAVLRGEKSGLDGEIRRAWIFRPIHMPLRLLRRALLPNPTAKLPCEAFFGP